MATYENAVRKQPPSAECEGAKAGNDALKKRNAPSGDGAVGGAFHLGVAGALESLIEGAGSGGDEADTDEGVEQTALHAGYSRLHRPEVETCPSGDDDHSRDTHLE